MSTESLDELERLAKAATPGPWVHHMEGSVRVCNGAHDTEDGCKTIVEAEILGYERTEALANASYLAALPPERVLALIAAVRLIESNIIALDDWLRTYASEMCDEKYVLESVDRIYEHGGTLAYIARLQQANRAALAAL